MVVWQCGSGRRQQAGRSPCVCSIMTRLRLRPPATRRLSPCSFFSNSQMNALKLGGLRWLNHQGDQQNHPHISFSLLALLAYQALKQLVNNRRTSRSPRRWVQGVHLPHPAWPHAASKPSLSLFCTYFTSQQRKKWTSVHQAVLALREAFLFGVQIRSPTAVDAGVHGRTA